MHILRRALALAFLVLAVSSCDGSNVMRGIRIARYSEAESQRVLKRFLTAAVRNDTTLLRPLATEPVLRQVARDHSDRRFLPEYTGAAASNRANDVEVVLGGADLVFTYEVDRQPRHGRASVRYQDGGWRVTGFSLMVEY
jgi:hypothetical protein